MRCYMQGFFYADTCSTTPEEIVNKKGSSLRVSLEVVGKYLGSASESDLQYISVMGTYG